MTQGRHECWLRPSGNTLMQQVKAARSRHLRRTTERVVFVFINSFQKNVFHLIPIFGFPVRQTIVTTTDFLTAFPTSHVRKVQHLSMVKQS